MPSPVSSPQRSPFALRDVTNTPCRIGHPPSRDLKISSPDKVASPSHDFYVEGDDADEEDDEDEDDGSYFLSDPPPSIPPLVDSSADTAPLQQRPVQFAVVHESGEHLLATIKQKVETAMQGRGRKISRLWTDGSKIKTSWRARAKATDWSSSKSIVKNFKPFKSKDYGQARPPPLIHAAFTHPFHKAHAVNAWNRMSPGQQGLLKKHCTDLAEAARKAESARKRAAREAKKLAKERAKEAARKEKEAQKAVIAAAKKRAREERAAAKRKEKTATERALAPMNSKVLGHAEAAAASVSQQMIQRAKANTRLQYDLPKKSTHLNDRAARRADCTLMRQFFKTARSITPPPDATNWVQRNNLIMNLDATEMAGRSEGTCKERNTMTAGSTPPLSLRIAAGHGGKEQCKAIMKEAIFSGEFDDVIAEYNQKRSLRSFQSNCTVSFLDGPGQIDRDQNARRLAGGQRSEDDIIEDNAIGATRIRPNSMQEFRGLLNA